MLRKVRKRRLFPLDAAVRELPVDRIHAVETRLEDDEALAGLAESISRFGLLHPLTVRRKNGRYELICGQRRLAAARLCGFVRVPCLIVEADDAGCRALRLAENLRRQDLDFMETASELRELVRNHGCSLEEAASCAGLPLGDAADKLHTLRLPGPLLLALRQAGLTQRHALALLRLPEDSMREVALSEMARTPLSETEAERYVDKLLSPPEEERRVTFVFKDVRIFLNSVSRGLDMMRSAGVPAECLREDADNCIKLTIRIPDRVGNT